MGSLLNQDIANNLSSEQKLACEVIKLSLHDLYKGNEKDREEAKLFFLESRLFKATGIDLDWLLKNYERTHKIRPEKSIVKRGIRNV